MKKMICLLLCLALFVSLPCTVFAAGNWVVDDADLLTADEESHLTGKIESVREEYELDIVIVTVDDLNGKSAQSYADDYYDENGYGYGPDYTGVLLLIAMDTREWYISTCGEAIYALTDYSLDVLGQEMVYFLSDGQYYGAFENFINSIPKYMIAYRQGAPMDGYVQPDDYEPEYGDEIVYYEDADAAKNPIIAVIIGFVAALIAILIMRSSMNTAKPQQTAVDYLKDNSYHLNTQRDMFLYSRTSKTRRQQNTSGGGSSVHRSSGGRSHGGRGGRF